MITVVRGGKLVKIDEPTRDEIRELDAKARAAGRGMCFFCGEEYSWPISHHHTEMECAEAIREATVAAG